MNGDKENKNNNKKKIKRKESIEKKLKHMKVYYVNCRGMKSKRESLQEIVEEIQPTIIGLVERHLDKGDIIEIEGYTMIRNDRNKEGGGVLLAVREELVKVTTEVARVNDTEEALWITTGTKTVYRIGVVCIPKGDQETKEHLKQCYEIMGEEIDKAEQKDQRVIMMGDFNYKIGKEIEGNKQETTKGGRMLLQMVKEKELQLVNKNSKCKGTWTRTEISKNKGEVKGVLDYIMLENTHIEAMGYAEIDEYKEKTPYRIVKDQEQIRTIYSDHNAMICNMKWDEIGKKERKKEQKDKRMTKESYKKFAERIEEQKVSEIWEKEGNLQKKYEE